MFIREKRISIGMFQEVDIFPLTTEAELKTRGKRRKKENLSRPAQSNLNDKNSSRYFGLVAKGNFWRGDYYLTLTFANKHLPKTVAEAKDRLKKFINKLKSRYKKLGKILKYMYVLEYQFDPDGKMVERLHFHLLMSQGLDRDELESCWSVGRGKTHEMLGRVNTRRIQPDSDGINALISYLRKKPRWKKGVKSWSGSRNLTRPVVQKNDSKYTRRKIEKYCTSNDYGFEELSKKYPDYHITEIKPQYNELKGWHLYLQMIKRE